jgi:hypothetical protein
MRLNVAVSFIESSDVAHLVVCFIFLSFGMLIVGCFVFHCVRANSLLRRWSVENGYRIVEGKERHFLKGPFFWKASNVQAVFRVTVEDAHGMRKRGWVCLGSGLLGIFSYKANVLWDE